jgi:hypothetical protein
LTCAAAALVGALCIASPASSTLYKWTDAAGVVVYSDQPPPGNAKVEIISGPPPPANPNAAKELANKELDLKKRQASAAEDTKKAAQERVDAEKQAGLCRDNRAQLSRLAADQVVLYTINEKGEQVVLSETERRRRREASEAYIRANCPAG